ncbi:hypothetical protein COOONC_16942 [Cooperia oncophora]
MHEKPYYYGQYIRGRTLSYDDVYENRNRGHVRRDHLRELGHSESEDTVDSEDDGCKPRRDKKFSLGDFILKEVQENSMYTITYRGYSLAKRAASG